MTNEDNHYTPRQLKALYCEQLRKVTPVMGLISVEGVYKPATNVYNNIAYDRIVDADTGDTLTIVVPLSLRMDVEKGNRIRVTGTVSLYPHHNGDEFGMRLYVATIHRLPPLHLTPDEERLFDCRRFKLQQGFYNVDQVIAGPIRHGVQLRLIAIYPLQSVAQADFIAGIGDAITYINIKEVKVNFSDSALLSQLLKEADAMNFDLIALLRGGGAGLSDLDNPQVAETLAQLSTPWLYGSGHEQDRLFIRSIADMAVPTPKAAGEYIRKIIHLYRPQPTPTIPTQSSLANHRIRHLLIASIIIVLLLVVALILK